MTKLPKYLVRLSLDVDADDRAIRRAYARELKLIDPEKDPDAFHVLRESYESARKWVDAKSKVAIDDLDGERHAETSNEESSSLIAQSRNDESDFEHEKDLPTSEFNDRDLGDNPPASKGERFDGLKLTPDDFLKSQLGLITDANCAFSEFLLSFQSALHSTPTIDTKAVQALLELSLDDNRLINVDARTQFEYLLAEHLVTGWQQGHHHLLEAGVKVFEWTSITKRLSSLEEPGNVISRALSEQLAFEKQTTAERLREEKLIQRMQSAEDLHDREVIAYVSAMMAILRRYPEWSRITLDFDRCVKWQNRYAKLEETSSAAIHLDIDPAQCRKSLTGSQISYLSMPSPSWLARDPLKAAVDTYPKLWIGGKIVWASLIQANGTLFSVGDNTSPGEVVYDPVGTLDHTELRKIARKLGALKGTKPSDPVALAIANHLTAETTRAFGLPVPESISSKSLRVATVLFHREHLPNKRLTLNYFPLLIHPAYPGIAMVLPSRWWPQELIDRWLGAILRKVILPKKQAPQHLELAHAESRIETNQPPWQPSLRVRNDVSTAQHRRAQARPSKRSLDWGAFWVMSVYAFLASICAIRFDAGGVGLIYLLSFFGTCGFGLMTIYQFFIVLRPLVFGR